MVSILEACNKMGAITSCQRVGENHEGHPSTYPHPFVSSPTCFHPGTHAQSISCHRVVPYIGVVHKEMFSYVAT